MPYNASASGGSNLGPTNPALTDAVKARIEALRAAKEKTIEMTRVNAGHDVRCIRLDSNGKLPVLTGGA